MRTSNFTPLGTVMLMTLLGPDCSARTALDEHRLLAAIAQVETGTRDLDRPCKCIGRAGERSAWQMKESTWHEYTPVEFRRASTDARLASTIAAMHLRTLSAMLELRGVEASPYTLAIAWNAGATVAIKRKESATVGDYATRVSNLYFAP